MIHGNRLVALTVDSIIVSHIGSCLPLFFLRLPGVEAAPSPVFSPPHRVVSSIAEAGALADAAGTDKVDATDFCLTAILIF
jgi:hypothetical protein